eukprot:7502673-Pyramimonas_sp.AAC.1
MVVDLLQTPEIRLDAQMMEIQKDVFEVLMTSNCEHEQDETPVFGVTAKETDDKRSHLDYPPVCPDCVYEGDDRDV